MAAANRANVPSAPHVLSFMNSELGNFHIEPEHLDSDEIKYELNVRGLPSQGVRRHLTAELRQAISNEVRGLVTYPCLSFGYPSNEHEKVRNGVSILRLMLDNVTSDFVTQQRFMTRYLHLEGRLNRIPKVMGDLNLTDVICGTQEHLSILYREFAQRLYLTRNPRRYLNTERIINDIPSIRLSVDSTHASGANPPPSIETVNDTTPNVQAAAIEQRLAENTPNVLQIDNLNVQGGAIRRTVQNENNVPVTGPQIYHDSANSQANIENTFDRLYRFPTERNDQRNLQNNDTDFVLLGQNIGNQMRSSSQRQGGNLDNRLSNNFRRSTGRPFTPIPTLNSNDTRRSASVAPNMTVNNNDKSPSVNVPPHNFGRNRRNSMPFGLTSIENRYASSSRNEVVIPDATQDRQQGMNNANVSRRDSMSMQNEQRNLPSHAPRADFIANGLRENNAMQATHLSENFDSEPNAGREQYAQNPPSVERNQNYERQFYSQNRTGQEHMSQNFIVDRESHRDSRPSRSFDSNFANHERFAENRFENTQYVHENNIRAQNRSNVGAASRNAEHSNTNINTDNISRQEFNQVLAAIHALTESVQNLNVNNANISRVNVSQNQSRSARANARQNVNTNTDDDNDNDRQSVMSERNSVVSHRPNTVRRRQSTCHQGLPIHKWNWYFTADKMSKIPEEKDLRAFFKKLEIYREAEAMTYDEVYARFHLLVKGHASDWYIQYRTQFQNWNELKNGLIKQYTTPLNKFMKTQVLGQCRQGKSETSSEFVNRMTREFDSMCMYDEYEKIPVIINGLRDELRDRALSRDWTDVASLNVFLSQMEIADELRAMSSHRSFNKFPFRKSVHAIETNCESNAIHEALDENDERSDDIDQESMEVCAYNTKRQKFHKITKPNFHKNSSSQPSVEKGALQFSGATDGKKLICFNCKSGTHRFRDCDKPVNRIFCFTCGAEGKLSPNCTHGVKTMDETKNVSEVACQSLQTSDSNESEME